MMRTALARLVLALLCSPGPALAQADEPLSQPRFSINAFGTAGLARSGGKRGDFTLHALQKEGARATRTWSAKVDSRNRAQPNAHPAPQLSAVLPAGVD